MDNRFFDEFLNKKVRVMQKDNFKKDGILRGYDDSFIYLEFSDGMKTAIAKDMILFVSEVEGNG